MDSPSDTAMGDDSNTNEPFTIEENIKKLNEIDNAIVKLMSHTATALSALTIPQTSSPALEGSKPNLDPQSQTREFHSATDSFLKTLHLVDAQMKRQILALEEAGITNMSNSQREDTNGPVKPSLKPNGVGAVGNLDVGWLNSRGTTVERDMEAELWGKAREFLEKEGGSKTA